MTYGANQHPEPEVLAAFIDGQLASPALHDVAAHVDHCRECLDIVGETVLMEREQRNADEEEAPPPIPIERRRHWSAIPLAAAAALAIVAGAWLLLRDRFADPMTKLVRVTDALPNRPIEARLERFGYAPLAVRRAAGPETAVDAPLLRARSAAADLAEATRNDVNDASHQHETGVAALIAGNPKEAVEHLERATALDPSHAEYWSDLAAARYESAQATNDHQQLVDALVAADHALREHPGDLSPLYNRALIIDALGLRDQAARAYDAYRKADPASGWSKEAEQRAARLHGTSHSELWRKEAVPRLRAAVAANDERAVATIVAQFPQESRSWGEAIFLNEWATSDASPGLAISWQLASALEQRSGEALLGESVAAIEHASPSQAAALRDAHHEYLAAGVLYSQRRVAEAMPLFERAAARFREGGSPMAAMADYYIANCLYDLKRNEDSLRLVDSGLSAAPPRYRALRAQLLWMRGTLLSHDGRVHEALAVQNESLQIFEALGEEENAQFMTTACAASLTLLGRSSDAWTLRGETFRRVSLLGNREYEQMALATAARTEALLHRWDRTYSLLTLAVDPSLRVNVRVAANSFLWRALSGQRIGAKNLRPDIEESRRIAASIPDPQIRRSAEEEALFGDGVLALAGDPKSAVTLLTRFIDDAESRRQEILLAEAYLQRGLARRALAEDDLAANDFSDALRWVGARAATSRDEFREAFFSTGDAARRELVALWDRRGDLGKAYEACSMAGSHPEQLVRSMPRGTLLVRYVTLPDHLTIFVVDSGGLHAVRVAVTAAALQAAVSRLASSMATEQEQDAASAVQQLSRWLVEPIGQDLSRVQSVVLVPDRTLESVPFATLPVIDGRALVEHASVAVAPDAVLPQRSGGAIANGPVLSVGNPRFDRSVFPNVPELGAAEAEAQEVAARWGATPLTGAAATVDAVRQSIAQASVAHIATHAFVASDDPSRSFLLFAPGATSAGALYLPEIEKMTLPSLRVVVLAGCRTGATIPGADVQSSLALAFLHAGAASVIGSLWDVDDAVGRRFSVELHRSLRAGALPAAALRDVQLAMLHSPDPAMRRLRAWGGFRLYSATL